MHNKYKTTTFHYTGKSQKIKLYPGDYFIECYGAKGGGNFGIGGDKTSGYIKIYNQTNLYLHIGKQPANYVGGWNGGKDGTEIGSFGGGGATDISLDGIEDSTFWDDEKHLNSIIIQASGGQGQGNTTGTFSSTRIDARTTYINRYGVYVAKITPKSSGTLLFQSSKYSADPYGFVDDSNGNNLVYNDDGAASLNFRISMSVTAGTTYKLRIGSFSSSLSTAGWADWSATFPSSEVKLNTSGDGGGNNYFHHNFTQTKITKFVNQGDGKIVITYLSYLYTDAYRRADHERFKTVFL